MQELEETNEQLQEELKEEKKRACQAKGIPKTKEEEYPQIAWDNFSDPDVQTATIIYNDRILTYRKMLQLDERLDADPTADDVKQMAETRIRNLQAFNELQSYNDTGYFKLEHPLIKHKTERAELEKLLRTDPDEFLRKHRRTLGQHPSLRILPEKERS